MRRPNKPSPSHSDPTEAIPPALRKYSVRHSSFPFPCTPETKGTRELCTTRSTRNISVGSDYSLCAHKHKIRGDLVSGVQEKSGGLGWAGVGLWSESEGPDGYIGGYLGGDDWVYR